MNRRVWPGNDHFDSEKLNHIWAHRRHKKVEFNSKFHDHQLKNPEVIDTDDVVPNTNNNHNNINNESYVMCIETDNTDIIQN